MEQAAAAELLEQLQTRHRADQRHGAARLRGKAQRIGNVQPGKEKLWGDPIVTFQDLKGT